MGAVQSLLGQDAPTQPETNNRRPSVEPLHLSWVSNKLLRDMAAKFSEIEMLSLRQLLVQLKAAQDKQDKQPDTSSSETQPQPQQQQHQKSRKVAGITEATFVVSGCFCEVYQSIENGQPILSTFRRLFFLVAHENRLGIMLCVHQTFSLPLHMLN